MLAPQHAPDDAVDWVAQHEEHSVRRLEHLLPHRMNVHLCPAGLRSHVALLQGCRDSSATGLADVDEEKVGLGTREVWCPGAA